MGKRPADDCCESADSLADSGCKNPRNDPEALFVAPDNSNCPLCQSTNSRWWPHIRMRFDDQGKGALLRCHLQCVRDVVERCGSTRSAGTDSDAALPRTDGGAGGVNGRQGASLKDGFADELQQLFRLSPQLLGRQPAVRLCFEELRLAEAAERWPPAEIPALPPVIFAIEGIVEIRISSCRFLRSLPREVGLCHGMKALVLISNGLKSIPAEVSLLHELEQLFLNGNFLRGLPVEVGTLPVLEELCVDSNLITSLPDFTSPRLELFTAPANQLSALPMLAGRLDRLDAHGNALSAIIPSGSQSQWDKIRNLKLMGNRLCELPEELGQMWSLRTLLVSGNRLTTLPACITTLRCLEWIFAYHNAIVELPAGLLLGSSWLDRILLEGNPLGGPTMDMLINDSAQSKVKVLSLDTAQVHAHAQRVEKWRDLPTCISVGDLVHTPDSAQYYMKLVRASQLRRSPGLRAAGEPGGPAAPAAAPAALLVVAFAASQGEPEWLGVLRRLAATGRATALPRPEGPITAAVGAGDPEARMAVLWSQCEGGASDGCADEPPPTDGHECSESSAVPLDDFDVLSVIDHRMRWYSEDAPAFAAALGDVVAQHRRTLCVGASMGGFGAMLHGGRLADAVIAFSPQSRLDQATLRPPAEGPGELQELFERVGSAVREGRARGARLEVHCAADEHCWHALSLCLDEGCITLHPLLPRKPFARLLDRAQLLQPILGDAICGLLSRATAAGGLPPPGSALPAEKGDSDVRVLIAQWRLGGRMSRHWASRDELLQMLFGPGAPNMPRPGDWFCPRCRRRNMSTQFFCSSCTGPEGARIVDAGVRKIPGRREYPRSGDWGCGKCGAALCGYDRACTVCWSTRDHAQAVVVA